MLIRTGCESSFFFFESLPLSPCKYLFWSSQHLVETTEELVLPEQLLWERCTAKNSVMINWNSMSGISLSAKALERSRSTVSRFAMASVTISWCFFIFESAFCWRLSALKKWERKPYRLRQVGLWPADQQQKEQSQNSRLKCRWENTRASSAPVNNLLGTFTGVTKQSNEVTSNEVTENRVTRKNFERSKILKSFKNM